MLYRILTNAQYRNDIVGIVSKSFDRFAVLDGAIYSKGAKQYAMVIEIDADKEQEREVQLVAGAISALVGRNHRTEVYGLEQSTLQSIDPQAEEAKLKAEKVLEETNSKPEEVNPKMDAPPVQSPTTGRIPSEGKKNGGKPAGKGEKQVGVDPSPTEA